MCQILLNKSKFQEDMLCRYIWIYRFFVVVIININSEKNIIYIYILNVKANIECFQYEENIIL